MGEYGLSAPGPLILELTGTGQHTAWKKWKQNLDCFFGASNIIDTKRKKSMLLYCGGEDLRKIHDTLNDTGDTYKITVQILEDYFSTKVNVTYERHLFRSIIQNNGETAKGFVTRLKERSKHCGFDKYSEEQALVDQFLEKCNSHRLRRKLLQEKDLNVEDIVKYATNLEVTSEQATALENSEQTEEVNMMRKQENRRFDRKWNQTGDERKSSEGSGNYNKPKCFACGKEGHLANNNMCPAKGRKCSFCGKLNHLEEVCYAKKNKERTEYRKGKPPDKLQALIPEDSDDEDYIFRLGSGKQTDIIMKVEGENIGFLVDSGALGVDVMDRNTFNKLKGKVKIKLYPSKTRIYGYASKIPLSVEGIFYGNASYKGTQQLIRFHVMTDEDSGCIIGRKTATELGLLNIPARLYNMQSEGKSEKWKTQYPEVFTGLGKLKNHEIKLSINKEVEPVSQHLRRIPFHVRKKVEKKVDELLKLDVIEKVEESAATKWVSPVIAIPKGDDIRMVVDMRKANTAIQRTHYPVPTLNELWDNFQGCTIFSRADFTMGYHQLLLSLESRDITSFITHTGIYRYKRLVQGANSALEEFQHVIGDLFKQHKMIANISDDILIGGRDKEEHDNNVKICLEILKENGLTLNQEKCVWGVPEVTFFGHTLSAEGIKPTGNKVDAIQAFPPPRNRKQLSSFLGLINFLAKFVPNLSSETEPIRRLLRKDSEWKWGQQEQETFEKLKKLVSSDTVLAHFNENLKTYLITDAGAVGLGAIVAQKQVDGSIRPVQYASRSLSAQEKKYSQTEKEALAVVWGCERHHLFLYGKPFTILTDHQPLKVLYSPGGKPSPRILRWTLRLQSYEYEIEHIPGSTNPADVLSNCPLPLSKDDENKSEEMETYINKIIAYATPKAITLNEVMEESDKDVVIMQVIDCLRKNEWPQKEELRQYKQVRSELMFKGGILMKGEQIVIPRSLRKRTLNIAHEAHMGIVKTKALVRDKVWWPGLDDEIEKMIKSCIPCLSMSTPKKEPMKHLDMPMSNPYEKVFIDLCGPFPSGEYVLGIIDSCSRWPDAHITKNTTSKAITNLLLQTFSTHGFPLNITTDNGPNLVSVVIEEFCREYGIKHHTSTPYWPQGNSEVERFYRTLGKFIKTCCVEGRRWQTEMHKFLLTYRNTPHCTTTIAPAVMLMNRKLRCKLPCLPQVSEHMPKAEKENEKRKEKNKKYYDGKRKLKVSDVKKGDWVLVKQKKRNKLSTNFSSVPLRVKAVEGSEIRLEKSNKEIRRNVNDIMIVPGYETSDESDTVVSSEDFSDTEREDSSSEEEDEPPGRPVRNRRFPARYENFIVDM